MAVEVINYVTKHGESFLADEKRSPHNVSALTQQLKVRYRAYPLVGVITPWN